MLADDSGAEQLSIAQKVRAENLRDGNTHCACPTGSITSSRKNIPKITPPGGASTASRHVPAKRSSSVGVTMTGLREIRFGTGACNGEEQDQRQPRHLAPPASRREAVRLLKDLGSVTPWRSTGTMNSANGRREFRLLLHPSNDDATEAVGKQSGEVQSVDRPQLTGGDLLAEQSGHSFDIGYMRLQTGTPSSVSRSESVWPPMMTDPIARFVPLLCRSKRRAGSSRRRTAAWSSESAACWP